MHVPILEEEEKQMIGSPQLGSAMTTSLARRRLLFADCLAVRSCPRRVKACLSLLFCLALLVLALYLDIVAVLFLDSLRRHSPERALPLRRPKLPQGNGTMVAEMEFEARSRRMRTALNASFGQLLHGLPARDSFWCDRMVQGQLGTEEAAELAAWKFNETQWRVLPDPKKERPEELPEAGCSALRRLFSFAAEPLSEEERQFPLAYGLLVYKSPMQIFSLLSAIYQPQNAYCLAIDERAGKQFKQEMNLLADCFPNIFAMEIVGPVEWCQFGVVRGVFSCLRHLSEMDHDWRYYQYLSGVDLPLKTNLEMVRIFKQLNGTINAELLPFETSRIPGEQVFMKSPLTLWKSSLSALLSREAVDTIIQSEKVRQLLRYLQFGYCQDEALWGTIAGNPKELFIPGGFDASYLYSRLFVETYLSQIRRKQQQRNIIQHQSTVGYNGGNKNGSNSRQAADEEDLAEPFQLSTYYISRFQVWTDINPLSGSQDPHCKGTFVKASCVFGIGDLPRLVKKPELVAHKLYLDFQPAAYFCLLKSIRERSLDWRNQQKFRGENYGELPTVKMARGEPESELRFFFD